MSRNDRLEYLNTIVSEVKGTYTNTSKRQVYQMISDLYKHDTGEEWSPDAVRKYTNKHCPHIIDALLTSEFEADNEEAGVAYEENGNEAVVTAYVPDVAKSLDELLTLFDVDTDVWEVDRYTINNWTTATAEGTIPNYQVKAFLIRKVPIIQDLPAIKPISISVPQYHFDFEKEQTSLRQALVIADSQIGFRREADGNLFPFHDRRALDLINQVAAAHHFDDVFILGDMLDFAQWSDKYLRSPDVYFTTQPALVETAHWLGMLRGICPDANMIYLEGNHEVRLRNFVYKYMMEAHNIKPVNAPSDASLFDVGQLLALDDINVEYRANYPYDSIWVTPELELYHGNVARAKGRTATAMLSDSIVSKVVGHVHRIESASKTIKDSARQWSIQAHTIGCLCHVDGRVPGSPREPQWQQGFGIITYDEDGIYQYGIESIPINDGEAVVRGSHFLGNETRYMSSLSAAASEYF